MKEYDVVIQTRKIGYSYVYCARVQNTFFIELLTDGIRNMWYHGLIYSTEQAGEIPELYDMTEEELFQYSTVNDFTDADLMLAVQKHILRSKNDLVVLDDYSPSTFSTIKVE